MKSESGRQLFRDRSRSNVAIGFIVGMMLGGLVDSYAGTRGIGTFIGMILGALLGSWALPRVHFMEYPPEVVRNLVVWGALFLVVLLGSMALISREIGGAFQGFLALAPIIPGFLFMIALGNAIASLDELQRKIQVESIAIGFGIAMLVAMTYGLLGLVGTPQPNGLAVSLIMVLCWLAGKLWTRWKYR